MENILSSTNKQTFSRVLNFNKEYKFQYTIVVENFVLTFLDDDEEKCIICKKEDEWSWQEYDANDALKKLNLKKIEIEPVEVDELISENNGLMEENKRLTEEVNQLRNENYDLRKENNNLKDIDKSSSDEVSETYDDSDNSDIEIDELNYRLKDVHVTGKNISNNQKIVEKKVKPVGKSISYEEMARGINRLKFYLSKCENIDADEKLKEEIKWKEDFAQRKEYLAEIISFTSEKGAGKNNFLVIYSNYRKLDFLKELYIDENAFKKEFSEAASSIKDNTKAFLRFSRWSWIFQKLPQGSYLSCSIPNSHWKLIPKPIWEQLVVSEWDNN